MATGLGVALALLPSPPPSPFASPLFLLVRPFTNLNGIGPNPRGLDALGAAIWA